MEQRLENGIVSVHEVHPFADGNGRVARIMMNAELVAAGQERIIIPTSYRTDYLGALKAMTHNAHMILLIQMLDYAQQYTHAIDWSDLQAARHMLEQTGAFSDGESAKLRLTEHITQERCRWQILASIVRVVVIGGHPHDRFAPIADVRQQSEFANSCGQDCQDICR